MCNCGEKCKINCTSSQNLYLELLYPSGLRPRLLYLVLCKWANIAQFLSLLYLHFFPLLSNLVNVENIENMVNGRSCESNYMLILYF